MPDACLMRAKKMLILKTERGIPEKICPHQRNQKPEE
jgi:hypothetical protein